MTAPRRARSKGGAEGAVLEIGSGTGLNLPHYPDDLDDLVLAEPDPSMRKRLQAAVREVHISADLLTWITRLVRASRPGSGAPASAGPR